MTTTGKMQTVIYVTKQQLSDMPPGYDHFKYIQGEYLYEYMKMDSEHPDIYGFSNITYSAQYEEGKYVLKAEWWVYLKNPSKAEQGDLAFIQRQDTYDFIKWGTRWSHFEDNLWLAEYKV